MVFLLSQFEHEAGEEARTRAERIREASGTEVTVLRWERLSQNGSAQEAGR